MLSLSAAKDWLKAALFTFLVLSAIELSLRAAGYRYAHYPVSMKYVQTIAHIGADQSHHQKTFHIDYTIDHTLLWRPVATPGITNSEGFLGPEWSPEKPPQSLRVITLGDSCTVAGETPYPTLLEGSLGPAPAGRRWEVWNAGVGSWSSYQGLKLLETKLVRYRPDVVSVYFGWNDHWLAWAAPDKDLSALLDGQWDVLRLVEKSRLLQWLLSRADRLSGGPKFSAKTPPRVALHDYAGNLRAMVRLVRASGGEAVLVTAPSTLTPEHPVTLRLVNETHNFFDPAAIATVHEAYNAQVRMVARELGTPLVDLAAEFTRFPRPETLFIDGIHLTVAGHRKAAEALAPAVRGAAIRPRP